jgi:hypothetical protein
MLMRIKVVRFAMPNASRTITFSMCMVTLRDKIKYFIFALPFIFTDRYFNSPR